MPTSTSVNEAISRYRTPILLVLITAGLLGNYLKYPIFLNIDFLFGSIFAMLAVQFLGLGRGVLAAAIIAGYTYFIWNHPYAIVIMTAEAAVVGGLMLRRGFGMVLADTLFWLFIGMPLVYIFYHLVMDVPASNTTIVMTKQAVNGIANALTARLIFTGFSLRSRLSMTSFSEIIYNLLALFVLFPALILLAVSSRTDFKEIDHSIRTTLTRDSRNMALRIETWVINRKPPIVNLAELAASKSTEEMQAFLEQITKWDVNFLRVGLVDKNANFIAFSPPLPETEKSAIGINFSERSYIVELRQTLKPMISEVIMGKVGAKKPRLLVLAPVVIDGQYAGHVTGAIDLSQIREHLDNSLASNATLYTLLDRSDNIIMTNRSDQAVMKPFVRQKGVLNRLDDQISQWVPAVPANTPISERWRQSFYIAESPIGSIAGWKLILEQPVAPFQKTLHHNYTGKLILLFVILLVSLVLAELLSRSMNVTFAKLGFITHDLSRKLSTDDREIAWPESSIKEAAHLISNFRLMSDSLAEQFSKIRQVNQSLEQLLGELRESEERFSCMFRKHSAVMLLIEPETGAIVDANLAAESFYEYPRQTLLDMSLEDINILPSDGVKASRNAVSARKNFIILPHRKASGEIRTVEVRSTPISVNGATLLFSIINDISERIQAEEERNSLQAQLQQVQKMEAIGTLAGGIAHDFNNILGALLGYAEIALEDCPPGSLVSNEIEQILKAGKRARDLVKQILAFSRQAETERIPMQPSVIARETVKMLRSTLPATIEIKQDIDPDAGTILADPTQVHQILMNLCTNAYHAMEEQGGTLTISLKREDLTEQDLKTEPSLQPGPFIRISIKDSGEGIAPEIRERIFDPYFTTKEVGKGSGMGLAILHGIVKSYNGFVTCRSTPSEGSVFDVFLPRMADEFVPEIISAVPIQGGNERILLIDDEPMLVEMGHKMLERLGYRVTSLTDSVEALSTFQDQPQAFDLVITDQTMPVMTGSDMARRMLLVRPDLPIILCTGYSSHISEEKARALGIQGFAMKPLVRKEIAALLRRVLDGIGT